MRAILPIVALLALAGCGPDKQAAGGPLVHAVSASGKYSLDLFTLPQPPVRGKIDAHFELFRQDGSSVLGMKPVVTPWMPQHGHGSSVTPTTTETEAGDYQIDDLYLPMEGLWQLRTVVDDRPDDEIDAAIEVR